MKFRTLMAGFLFLLPALFAAEKDPFGQFTLDEVAARLGKPGVHVYDVNPSKVYGKGHVPGAINLHFKKFEEKSLPKDKTATLIFYCQNLH